MYTTPKRPSKKAIKEILKRHYGFNFTDVTENPMFPTFEAVMGLHNYDCWFTADNQLIMHISQYGYVTGYWYNFKTDEFERTKDEEE
jgi:hypothetical protein